MADGVEAFTSPKNRQLQILVSGRQSGKHWHGDDASAGHA
jgi:hypothetical protein